MSITKLSLLLSHYNVNIRASLLAQMVKNLPATWETWVQSLEDSREGMAITSVFFFFFSLQYSYLENSMDRGAWWATVHGVTKKLDMTEQLTHL